MKKSIKEVGEGYIYVISNTQTKEVVIAPSSKSFLELGFLLKPLLSRNIWKNGEMVEGKSVLPKIRGYVGYLLKRNRKFDDIHILAGYSYDGKYFEIDTSVEWGEEETEIEWEKRFWLMYSPDENL